MNFQDSLTSPDVRPIDHDPSIEAPRSQERRIEDVGPVGRRHQNDAFVADEAVHLHEQLIERLLALIMAATQAGTAMTANGVNLVDEDDAGRVLLPCSNRSRTREAPTPTNISTKSDPDIEKNGTLASPATARP